MKHINQHFSRFNAITNKEKMTVQLWLGVGLAIIGVALLWTGLFIAPVGEIHPSVLTALGEIFTFSGACVGIDYSYKVKSIKYIADIYKPKKDDEDEEDVDENEQ
jgi:drug/metabolite transporter (DMT)-like permease